MKIFSLVILFLALTCSASWGQEPTYKQGVNIFIETGVTQPDRIPTWYAPMVAMPYAPVFEILATKGTQGRYYERTYAVTIKDIIKWHGHDCEGITHVANCAKIAFDILFPDGIIDRSVLKAISGTGPCWSDGVAFLTGARLQYGTLGFFKNKDYNHAIILYREDTKVAVLATLKKGINNIPNEPVVLPEKITWKTKVNMQDVIDLKKEVKNPKGTPVPYQVDLLRYYQWMHVNDILSRPLTESYQAQIINDFKWDDWVDTTKTIANPHKRGDIRLKNYPYREKPITEVK
ncbi:MAG: formylmethanofuran dehydrogenase subunit E family protein [Proteobacteria bacterium]|nr:formylmethanofuran dehydrogenase subunit E family protein [Pseudomonadota bacterium]MBU1232869.1 formylmethanofuran dehydrogenase subunit E family protein [Pseudomonadota bacterium]MBU1418151.1 formylmethanofuran dehydrogenase subunit E family protein [Pseudomonadota bacterium]MBU1454053.1 formylmethanofuran dehydrogenase subunit E family protein [Pseudomonadota bacterium]